MNKGRKWSFEEIDAQKRRYDANVPLEREQFETMFNGGQRVELGD